MFSELVEELLSEDKELNSFSVLDLYICRFSFSITIIWLAAITCNSAYNELDYQEQHVLFIIRLQSFRAVSQRVSAL